MVAIAIFVAVLCVAAVSMALRGYVLTVLWAWFVIPAFGLPALALAPAIGLTMIVSFLTHQSDAVKEPEGDATKCISKAFAYALVLPALVLCTGWVVKQFM